MSKVLWIIGALCVIAIITLQAAAPVCDALVDVEMIYCQESGIFLAGAQLTFGLLIVCIVSYFAFRHFRSAQN